MPAPKRWVEWASSPRGTSVPVPVRQEEVAAVVADLHDSWVHGRDLRDVGRVEDDLAAVGDDRLDLVEALGPRPEVGVPLGMRESTRWTGLSRYRCGSRPRRPPPPPTPRRGHRRRGTAPRRVVVHDHAQRVRSPGTRSAAASTNARTGCHATGADDLVAGDQRTEPVCDVDHLLARQAGNRYLLPPEKPMTSCGSTGPTISVTSLSTTSRLMRTSIGSLDLPADRS